MCPKCDDLAAFGKESLDQLLTARRENPGTEPDDPSKRIMKTANSIRQFLPPEIQDNPEAQTIILTLAAAVERLVGRVDGPTGAIMDGLLP